MASSTPVARVVSKEKYDQQHFLDVDVSKLPPLAGSSVRIQSRMFALSSNNLSYCAMGDILHWWKAFALPSYLPAPFNDPETYGIPPGWGIAHVVESTIPALEPGQTLFGFIPTSTMLADLQLEQSEDVPGHWLEVSKHREQLMSLYNRYLVTGEDFGGRYSGVDAAYWITSMILPFESGWLFNRVFTARPEEPIPPLPESGMSWSVEDADLSSTLLIVLGAGGKSARSFMYQVATNRRDGEGPKGLMEVTSGRESPVAGLDVRFTHRTIGYDAIQSTDTLKWIENIEAKRIMILDFGGRGDPKRLTLRLRREFPQRKVDLTNIGGKPMVYSAADKAERLALSTELQALRMNHSGIRDAVMQQIGEKKYFDRLFRDWETFVQSAVERHKGTEKEGLLLGVKLDVRKGVSALEETWSQLPQGQIPGNVGCVISL
ncbi:hypothetical protein LTR70_006888 [Exophiala xenobiotica]|uniref:Uncharacterized protein n=1 Tax=Lithohypha guttulata TaxID=1690604 RepID=A0ABR0K6Y4_9EURO|nr:hypothetical protein LTR24_006378 [Lithohypha guttulata]KAK5315149.1 hypothetical protein LTR70_006888 [Exophiala xenobiotica]